MIVYKHTLGVLYHIFCVNARDCTREKQRNRLCFMRRSRGRGIARGKVGLPRSTICGILCSGNVPEDAYGRVDRLCGSIGASDGADAELFKNRDKEGRACAWCGAVLVGRAAVCRRRCCHGSARGRDLRDRERDAAVSGAVGRLAGRGLALSVRCADPRERQSRHTDYQSACLRRAGNFTMAVSYDDQRLEAVLHLAAPARYASA